jgi:hypothetical protein
MPYLHEIENFLLRKKMLLFTTTEKGPRRNAFFLSPSHGLFLTCRGEKNIFKTLANLQHVQYNKTQGRVW